MDADPLMDAVTVAAARHDVEALLFAVVLDPWDDSRWERLLAWRDTEMPSVLRRMTRLEGDVDVPAPGTPRLRAVTL